MGGFFLSNGTGAIRRVAAFFERMALPFERRRLGEYELLLLRKKHVVAHNWFEGDEGRIAGVGTWLTEGGFGAAALPEVLESFAGDRSPLREVAGHFAFVAQRGDEGACIITEKTGTYPVYAATEAGVHHYSSSLLAVVEALDRTGFNPQGLLEFINMEAVLGWETLFRNVRMLPFGALVQVPVSASAETVTRYYEASDQPIRAEAVPDMLLAQVGMLKHSQLEARDICCDLSGGYDSRAVAALLHRAEVPHILDTNVNSSDPGDHAAAIHAAQELQRPIVVYSFSKLDPRKGALDYVFDRLDMARDVHRARETLAVFESKSSNHALLLGGYGGELLRDIYSGAPNLRQAVAKYYGQSLRLPQKMTDGYSARLCDKFRGTLAYAGFADDERASERVYFLEKMRVWGGTRIAVYNRYAYGWHPLLDHRVQRYLFGVSLAAKAEAKLQREIIALDAELAKQPYTRSPKQIAAERRQQKSVRRYVERTRLFQSYKRARRALFPKRDGDLTSVPPGYAAAVAEFEALTGLSLRHCTQRVHRTRYLSLVDCFTRYRDKLG
ncbi:MAG TPA: hypothetical protein VMG12_45015 [Polyangiaceae bacterium]|nr:hypothetical protein [Polyangiaceae bacterium]